MNGNHFDTYEDHNYYLLAEDALRCISYDFYFSPTYKYYCGAGCKVCYIRENLTEGVNHYAKSIPEEITQADTDYWYSIFKNFYSIRTDDDLRYLKKHHNHVYQWYVENASVFEFGIIISSITCKPSSVCTQTILVTGSMLKSIPTSKVRGTGSSQAFTFAISHA